MNRKDIARNLVDAGHSNNLKDATAIIDCVLDSISQELIESDTPITLIGFGTIDVVATSPRSGVTPAGDTWTKASSHKPRVRFSSNLMKQIADNRQ